MDEACEQAACTALEGKLLTQRLHARRRWVRLRPRGRFCPEISCSKRPRDHRELRTASLHLTAYLLQHVYVGPADADSSHSYPDVIAWKISSERQIFKSQIVDTVQQSGRVLPAFRDLCTNVSFEKRTPQLTHRLSSGQHDLTCTRLQE